MSLIALLRNPDIRPDLAAALDDHGFPELAEAILQAQAFLDGAPPVGSVWRHPGRGTSYIVRAIANRLIADDKFPITVVYEDIRTGETITRALWNWKGFELVSLSAE